MKKILAMLVAVMLVLSFAGCSGEKTNEESVALIVGEREYTVEDMNYMYVSSFNEVYNSFYSYYGDYISMIIDTSKPLEEQMIGENETWHDYIKRLAVDTVKSMTAIYEEALANGFVLDEIYQQDLDTLEEQLEKIASEVGMTSEEYLNASYGETVGLDAIKKMTELQIYCNAYVQDYKEKIEVSEKDIAEYYEANKKDIDTVDFRYYTTFYGEAEGEESLTKEEAEEKANLLSETKTAEEFNALAKEFTTDEEQKKLFDENDATIFPGAGYSSTGIDEVSEWLFEDGRKQGDTMIYHDEEYQSFITIMFEKRIDPDYDYINVRHVLITPEEAEDGSISDEAWTAAEEKANEIYNGYLAGEMTEEAFAELAKEHSADGNAAEGGIYENVYKGQMVTNFNDWCFDEARVPGDSGIVKTPYGYHLMYFVGTGDNNLISTVEPLVIQEELNDFLIECESKLVSEETEEMANVGGMIDEIVAAGAEAGKDSTEKETKSFTGIIIGVLVAVIVVCIVIIIKNGGKKKAEPAEESAETEEPEEPVLEATDEDLTEEELLAEEAFEENVSEETAEEVTEEVTEEEASEE